MLLCHPRCRGRGAPKIAADVDSADLRNISGTPTFFINDQCHHGTYDIGILTDAVRSAKARVLISARRQPRDS